MIIYLVRFLDVKLTLCQTKYFYISETNARRPEFIGAYFIQTVSFKSNP